MTETSFTNEQVAAAKDIDDPGGPIEPDVEVDVTKLTKAYQQLIRAEARAEAWGNRLRRFLDQGCTCRALDLATGHRCAWCEDREENKPGNPPKPSPFGRSSP